MVLPGGAARDDEFGTVHLGHGADGRVFASVTTPTQPNRRGALTFVLDTRPEGITLRQMQRVHIRGDHRTGTLDRVNPPTNVPLEEQLRRARTDRDQANAALTSLERRLGNPADGPQPDETRHARDSWRKIVIDLDREVEALGRRRLARHRIDPPGRSR